MAKSAAIESVGDNKLGAMKAWPQRAKSFYNDVRTEMRKVTTPSRKEVQGTTTVVIITVFLFGAVFLDRGHDHRQDPRSFAEEPGAPLMRGKMTEEEIKSESNGAEREPETASAQTNDWRAVHRRIHGRQSAEPEYEVVHHPHLFGI